ncbi:FAD/NAD-P-binding domain-containing protein [Trametes meyenii]|nr:FAD/NAD-P-binding domain-containing protein [Trametes meyenii]
MVQALDAYRVATEWLAPFGDALSRNDAVAATELFLPDGWLRDVLVFTWDFRALAGREKILSYLSDFLTPSGITYIQLDERLHLAPRESPVPQLNVIAVEVAFTFQCARGPGRAYARLLPDEGAQFKAFTLLMELKDLRGHEEKSTLVLRDDVTGVLGRDMQREFTEWLQEVETKPHVLIVGGAQTGLQVAAQFKQMDIPALVIERCERVGDNWRKRYPSLTLHTISRHHSMLFQPFPTNWPEFTPRDKFADWLEQYAHTQDLVVWTSTEMKPGPVYDFEKKEWVVTVVREGQEVKLHPAHIVFANGTLSRPRIPQIPDSALFEGTTLHSSEYTGADPFVGKRVVVIGAGNSSIDICQNLALNGAASVTMVQRSPTCVLSREYVCEPLRKYTYPEEIPVPIADFKWASFPLGLLKKLSIADQQPALDANRELHEKLRKGGIRLNMGDEGQGLYLLAQEKLAGLDKGGADLIADGRITVKSGVSPQSFKERALVMNDGSELGADVVVFATGYHKIREVNAELLSEEVVQQLDEVFGLDEEGEMRAGYRPCGYPGAMQIKAIQLGLLPNYEGKRPARDVNLKKL